MKKKIEFSENLKSLLQQTSNEVAADLDGRAARSKRIVAEVCLDANRMSMFYGDKGKLADAEVTILVNTFGYDKVLREATKYVYTY